MLIAVSLLLIVGLLSPDRANRRAMVSYAAIYFAGMLIFRVLGWSHLMTFDRYLLALGTGSFAQIIIYALLPNRGGIIMAAMCEVLLIGTYIAAYLRVPELLAYRVEVWQSINLVAVAALFFDWWTHGLPLLAAGHQWIRPARAAGAATAGRRVVACYQTGIMAKANQEKMS